MCLGLTITNGSVPYLYILSRGVAAHTVLFTGKEAN